MRAFLVVVLALWFAFASPAEAQVQADFTCQLDAPVPSCADVAHAFFSSTPGVERSSVEALVHLRLHTEDANGLTRYVLVAEAGRGPRASRLTIEREHPQSLSDDARLLALVAQLQQAVIPFLEADGVGESSEGQMQMTFGTPTESTDDGDPGRWYFKPTLSAEAFSAGLTAANVSGGFEVNYSDPTHRLRVLGSAQVRYIDVDLGEQTLSGFLTTFNGQVTWARSLSKNLSLAIGGRGYSAPNDNLAAVAEARVGAEWLLSSFIDPTDPNLGVRLEVLGRYQGFVAPTQVRAVERLDPIARLGLSTQVHAGVIDVFVEAGTEVPLTAPSAWSVEGGAELSVRPTDSLSVGINVGARYRGASLSAPASSDQLDPVHLILGGSDTQTFAFETGLSVSYTFGNSLLNTQDQRWR